MQKTKKKLPTVCETEIAADNLKVQINYTENDHICKTDTPQEELETKFAPKRRDSEVLSSSYSRLGKQTKAFRVGTCGTILDFARPVTGGVWKLHAANFCRDRLCPMCSWRRSYKVFGQVSRIMNEIEQEYTFLFLTLTVPNSTPEGLSELLDAMNAAWDKLRRTKRFKGSVMGYFKALEVTYNRNRYSKSFNTYHPHFHVILAVEKSYFGRQYISRDEWLQMWQVAMDDFSITQVDIRRCSTNSHDDSKLLSAAVAEVAKYAVKSSDYLFKNDQMTDDVVSIFSDALHSKRLIAMGGIFLKTHKQLQLDDVENGDLINFDSEEIRDDIALQIVRYKWSSGAYKLIDVILE